MRGKVTLHNLGDGFFGKRFEDLEKRMMDHVEGVADEIRAHARTEAIDNRARINSAAIERRNISHYLSMRLDGLRDELKERIRGEIEKTQNQLEVELGELKRDVDELGKSVNFRFSLEASLQKARMDVARIDSHNNTMNVMRQNVYLIELLRDLFDKEPKYTEPRRWYDHGWR